MVETTEEESKGPKQGEELAEIGEIYDDNEATDPFADEFSIKFTVRNPQDYHGHIVYEVSGVDEEGDFMVKRRYNDFYIFHEQLAKRWPGVIVPQIPAKSKFSSITAQGKDEVFLQERRFYLERFMRKLSRFDYIINGEECNIFFRSSQDVSKALNKLPALSSEDMYKRLSESLNISVKDYDEGQVAKFDTIIAGFSDYHKKVHPMLSSTKVQFNVCTVTKQNSIKSYSKMAKILNDYEEQNGMQYSELDMNQQVISNPNNAELKESLNQVSSN